MIEIGYPNVLDLTSTKILSNCDQSTIVNLTDRFEYSALEGNSPIEITVTCVPTSIKVLYCVFDGSTATVEINGVESSIRSGEVYRCDYDMVSSVLMKFPDAKRVGYLYISDVYEMVREVGGGFSVSHQLKSESTQTMGGNEYVLNKMYTIDYVFDINLVPIDRVNMVYYPLMLHQTKMSEIYVSCDRGSVIGRIKDISFPDFRVPKYMSGTIKLQTYGKYINTTDLMINLKLIPIDDIPLGDGKTLSDATNYVTVYTSGDKEPSTTVNKSISISTAKSNLSYTDLQGSVLFTVALTNVTGLVQLYRNGVSLGSPKMISGTGSISVLGTELVTGTYNITAVCSGVTSNALPLNVDATSPVVLEKKVTIGTSKLSLVYTDLQGSVEFNVSYENISGQLQLKRNGVSIGVPVAISGTGTTVISIPGTAFSTGVYNVVGVCGTTESNVLRLVIDATPMTIYPNMDLVLYNSGEEVYYNGHRIGVVGVGNVGVMCTIDGVMPSEALSKLFSIFNIGTVEIMRWSLTALDITRGYVYGTFSDSLFSNGILYKVGVWELNGTAVRMLKESSVTTYTGTSTATGTIVLSTDNTTLSSIDTQGNVPFYVTLTNITGLVQLKSNGVNIGSSVYVSGTSTILISGVNFPVGSYNIVAVCNGVTSNSITVNVQAPQAISTVNISTSKTLLQASDLTGVVIFSISLNGVSGATQLLMDGNVLGTSVTITNTGSISILGSSIPSGTHDIVAVCSGVTSNVLHIEVQTQTSLPKSLTLYMRPPGSTTPVPGHSEPVADYANQTQLVVLLNNLTLSDVTGYELKLLDSSNNVISTNSYFLSTLQYNPTNSTWFISKFALDIGKSYKAVLYSFWSPSNVFFAESPLVVYTGV